MVCAREVVLPWVHVWSARMSVRVQASTEHFSAEKVGVVTSKEYSTIRYRNETRYLKGCFVRTFRFATQALPLLLPPHRRRPHPSVPLEFGKFCSHAASGTRGASCAATCYMSCTCGLPVVD